VAEAKVSGSLPLPPAQAWALLSDLSRFDEWMTIHNDWIGPLPNLVAGAKVTQQLTVMGLTSVVEWTIDDFAPPSSLRISGTGLAGAQIAFTLGVAPSGDESTVSIDAEFTGEIMVGAIGEAVEQHAAAELQNSLANLQRIAL
jgi:carbon monoxide dehydrogenase subunit G